MAQTKAVLVHGAGGGAWEWEKWQEELKELDELEVVAISLDPVKDNLAAIRLDDYYQQVKQAADGHHDTVLIGASLGGLLCLLVAQERTVRALILVASALPALPDCSLKVYELGDKPFPPVVRWAQGDIEATRRSMPNSDDEMVTLAWRSWRNESGRVLNELRDGVLLHEKISCPMLFIIPGADEEIPALYQQTVAEYLGADILTFPELTHLGPLLSREAPVVAAAAARWLKEALGRRWLQPA